MATSSIPTVKAQIVSQIQTTMTAAGETSVVVAYAWPGPDAGPESIFLGPHPETADIRIDGGQSIPVIKAGRQRRDEEYEVPITFWVFRDDLTPAGAQEAEERCFELMAHVEDDFADTPRLGLSPQTIQWMEITGQQPVLHPFNAGWACEGTLTVSVRARLV